MLDETATPDPAIVPERANTSIHKEDADRVLMNKLPGFISDMSRGANHPGCRMVMFSYSYINGLDEEVYKDFMSAINPAESWNPAYLMNEFFKRYANYYLANVWVTEDGIYCLYSSILDTQDTQDLAEISMEVRKQMNKKRAEREAKQREEEEAKKTETEKLLELGRKAQEYNLIERLRELEEENKALKQNIKAAKRG